jgi:hypothetical protein
MSPHNFVFSKPTVVERPNFRNELRDVWEEWVHELPLALMVEEIWERLPRVGKTKALAWARNEVAVAREGFYYRERYASAPGPEDYPRLVDHADDEAEVRRPPTPRRPPWPTHLFRGQRGVGLVKYDDQNLIQLLALARIFSLAGLSFSLLQPSEKALENTEFYDYES